MIDLSNICKSYRTRNGINHVLNNVNLKIEQGMNLGILGLNGSGKSTLIRIIGGAELADSGEVRRTSTVSWPVGFSGCFNGSLTGKENLRFVSRIYGADIGEVSDFVADFSELGEYMDMPVKTYSSGMRSKLAFGLSLAIGFDFYLVDEAFSVGDATFKQKAQQVLKERIKDSSLVFVSHSPSSIKAHCNCGAVLNKGKLLFYPNLTEALDHYKEICNERKQ